jgi:hypothetical protein
MDPVQFCILIFLVGLGVAVALLRRELYKQHDAEIARLEALHILVRMAIEEGRTRRTD